MRKLRKKIKRPRTPWDVIQIREEKKTLNEYGLRRKKEIRVAQEILRKFWHRARKLIAVKNAEEQKTLLDKMVKLGLLTKKEPALDDILELTVENVLDRRLQTMVFRKGMAKTVKEARQMITHGHIMIDDRKIRFPSYIVSVSEEKKIHALHGKGG